MGLDNGVVSVTEHEEADLYSIKADSQVESLMVSIRSKRRWCIELARAHDGERTIITSLLSQKR
jgi:hypothetical protein